MDIHDALDDALAVLEAGKARAFGGGAVVDRDRLVDIIARIRASLPEEIVEARALLAQRETVLADANASAEQHLAQTQQQAADVLAEAQQRAADIVTEAMARQEALIAENEIVTRAQADAEAMLRDARDRGARMQSEVDDYVVAKLDALGATLHKALETIEAGRDRLTGHVVPRP